MSDHPAHRKLVAAIGDERGTGAANRLCAACVELFDIDAAAISLVFDGSNAGTLGASDEAARGFDEVQFTMGEGPCLDSVAQRAPVLVPDLATAHDRWPAYTPAMLRYDIHGVFAVPVVIAGEYVGALDLFSFRPRTLSATDIAGALIAAELAEMPLLDLVAADVPGATGVEGVAWSELNALTRAEISQATGMIIAQLGIEPAEALVRLRAHAFVTGSTATRVAREILERRLVLDTDEPITDGD